MKPQAFQPGELRDENNNIIREGAYGKKTPFCNAENMGILDYIINNLDVLYKGLLINGISVDENGTPSLSPEVTQAMENIKQATEAARDVALTAKEAAAASAEEAAGSATSAFEAANNASTSANNAASSASAASTSASNAAGSASTASTKATSASTSASNAAKSATEAQNSATQASSLVSKAAYGFIQRNKAYAVGDIAYCEQFPAGYYLECVTAGTTGNTEPTFKVGGVKVLDGSVEWDVYKTTEFNVPVGTIITYAANRLVDGFLVCDGAAVSRTTYARLFTVIGTTYGAGDGSTTFNLPLIENNRFIEYASEAGHCKDAGLPNITGRIENYGDRTGIQASFGCFYAGEVQNSIPSIGESVASYTSEIKTIFDASRSSAVYGKSDTVQPKSITLRAMIKY